MNLINCPECESEIYDRIGTVCPKCGHTVSYFEGDEKKKKYGKFFAISIFVPFISFILIIFTSWSKIGLAFSSIFYIVLAVYSCPIRFKDLFFTRYEKLFFWGIWLIANSLMVTLIVNSFYKL